MSHKFSFLQAFAGYYSRQCKLLSNCRQKDLFKSVSVWLRVKYSRQFKRKILAANGGKSGTQICQLAEFSQLESDFGLLLDAHGAYQWFRLVFDIVLDVTINYLGQYQYKFQYLKKFASINHFSLRKENWFLSGLTSTYKLSQNCN